MKVSEELNEGIRFFKNSDKLQRLIRKISKTSQGVTEVHLVADKLNKISNVFKQIEMKFRGAGTEEERKAVKDEYRQAEIKYIEFLNILKNEKFIKALKIAGVSAFVVGALFLLFLDLNKVDAEMNSIHYKENQVTNAIKDFAKKYGVVIKTESDVDRAVNGLLKDAAYTGGILGAFGLTQLFGKIFRNRENIMFKRTKVAISNLEKK